MESVFPHFPLEVVSTILGHCGREELLRVRLVCKDWNDLCLRHLAKSSHTIKLPYKKIKAMVKFLKTGSRLVLPLELTIANNEAILMPVLESLLDVIDPTCSIVVLNIGKMYRLSWTDFYPFLEKISPGLQCLNLPHYFFGSNDVGMEEKTAMITFPKLRILRLPKLGDMESTFDSYSSLMSRCPALEVLEVNGSFGTNPGNIQLMIPLQRIKSLSANCMRDPHILLNQIRKTEGGPKLESFRCNSYNSHRPQLLELLQELAPNLRHFFHSISSLADPLISHILFPKLTRLDVGINISSQELLSGLNLDLCARLLPALTTLAIPIGQYLVAESELSTVRHLILKVPIMEGTMTRIDYNEFFSYLFGVCPNVKRVDMEGTFPGPSIWISELLKCPEAVGIEEFGIWNYNYIRDWIAETTIAATQPGSSRTFRNMPGRQHYQGPILYNVRKIRLSPVKYNCNFTSYYGKSPQVAELDFSVGMTLHRHSKSKKRTRLHLSALRNQFPNLRSLELSPRMLGSDYDSSWRAVREIQSIYPDWTVNLIADDSELFPECHKAPYI